MATSITNAQTEDSHFDNISLIDSDSDGSYQIDDYPETQTTANNPDRTSKARGGCTSDQPSQLSFKIALPDDPEPDGIQQDDAQSCGSNFVTVPAIRESTFETRTMARTATRRREDHVKVSFAGVKLSRKARMTIAENDVRVQDSNSFSFDDPRPCTIKDSEEEDYKPETNPAPPVETFHDLTLHINVEGLREEYHEQVTEIDSILDSVSKLRTSADCTEVCNKLRKHSRNIAAIFGDDMSDYLHQIDLVREQNGRLLYETAEWKEKSQVLKRIHASKLEHCHKEIEALRKSHALKLEQEKERYHQETHRLINRLAAIHGREMKKTRQEKLVLDTQHQGMAALLTVESKNGRDKSIEVSELETKLWEQAERLQEASDFHEAAVKKHEADTKQHSDLIELLERSSEARASEFARVRAENQCLWDVLRESQGEFKLLEMRLNRKEEAWDLDIKERAAEVKMLDAANTELQRELGCTQKAATERIALLEQEKEALRNNVAHVTKDMVTRHFSNFQRRLNAKNETGELSSEFEDLMTLFIETVVKPDEPAQLTMEYNTCKYIVLEGSNPITSVMERDSIIASQKVQLQDYRHRYNIICAERNATIMELQKVKQRYRTSSISREAARKELLERRVTTDGLEKENAMLQAQLRHSLVNSQCARDGLEMQKEHVSKLQKSLRIEQMRSKDAEKRAQSMEDEVAKKTEEVQGERSKFETVTGKMLKEYEGLLRKSKGTSGPDGGLFRGYGYSD